MPRNMSFALTTQQIIDETKTVTRRNKWLALCDKPNLPLWAVKKTMGIEKGGKVERIKLIVTRNARREPLNRMLLDPAYGRMEVVKEGFPDLTPKQFVEMYCDTNRVQPADDITRIAFDYLRNPIDCDWCHPPDDEPRQVATWEINMLAVRWVPICSKCRAGLLKQFVIFNPQNDFRALQTTFDAPLGRLSMP